MIRKRIDQEPGWYVGTHQDQAEALLPATQQNQGNLTLAIIISVCQSWPLSAWRRFWPARSSA